MSQCKVHIMKYQRSTVSTYECTIQNSSFNNAEDAWQAERLKGGVVCCVALNSGLSESAWMDRGKTIAQERD